MAMTQSRPATEVEKGLLEPQTQHHDRVESLWAQLEPSGNGELDLKGLKKGFKKIDHRKKLLALFSFAPLRILPHNDYLGLC